MTERGRNRRSGTPAIEIKTRNEAAVRTVVLHPDLRQHAANGRTAAARLEEARGLAQAIGLEVVAADIVPVGKIRPATLFGVGKIEEFGSLIKHERAELAVVDGALTPVQQRNLERAWGAKVIDRTGLILEIFGERAETREGRLQVELAHLVYQRSRLVRSWTHLERQRGGAGFMGGPGEAQIELDRRLLDERIVRLRKQLDNVVRTRTLHRRSRKKVPYPIVALVGYTNAGKSTLFNRLTKASVRAEDLLFATLDPTMRAIELPSGGSIILSDTVGFISDLPTHLVAAFRATLEEVMESDVIVHVRDIAHPETNAQAEDVADVLRQLGIDEGMEERVVTVYNKIDLLDAAARERLENQAGRNVDVVVLSAATGEGCEALLARLDEKLGHRRRVVVIDVDLNDGKTIAWIYRHGEVLRRDDNETSTRLEVGLEPADIGRFRKAHPASAVVEPS